MKELNKLIEGVDVSYPVRYEDGVVYDAKGWFICELMGGAEREPTEHEDSLGNLIAHALNNLGTKSGDSTDSVKDANQNGDNLQPANDWRTMESAPKDEEIEVAFDEQKTETCIAVWSERPVCMLGPVNGGFPAGWATAGGQTDSNLPLDTPLYWRSIPNNLDATHHPTEVSAGHQPKEGEVGRGKCKSREDGVCRLPAGSCEQCDLTAEQLERSLGFKLHEVKVFRNGGWISAASVQPKEQTIIAYVEESLERLRKRNEEEHSEWWFTHRSGEISALEHIVEKFSQSPTEPVSGRTGEEGVLTVQAVIDWMNSWDQIRGTIVPIRFREDFKQFSAEGE